MDRSLSARRSSPILWLSGVWVLPFLAIFVWYLPAAAWARVTGLAIFVLLAPLPTLVRLHREKERLQNRVEQAENDAAQQKLQLEAVRSRTAQLREELEAGGQQAKRADLLVLLGQFTAGFMHEFNNPLAIVAGRLEVLIEERKDDAELCTDLNQMLRETAYMANISKTMLQALRKDRGAEVFEPAAPQKALEEAVAALRPSVESQNVTLVVETAETPRVDVPNHVIDEVVRGMLSNALKAVKIKDEGWIRVCLEPYRTGSAKVELRIEDNGPGVPEAVRPHLFEPFVTQNLGRETLGMGLGLFLAASLLDMYDGRIRYENRAGGGASFVLELPPARITPGRPYHWFRGGTTG